MKLLVMQGRIVGIAPNITFGVYDEPFEKWRLADENDNLMHYMIDSDFELVEDVTLPDDYEGGKYFYENGEFVLNEEWRPYVPTEKRIEILEETVAEQEELLLASDETTITLYEMQLTQSEINDAQDEAITGLYELMLG